jgi:hypothetical protein
MSDDRRKSDRRAALPTPDAKKDAKRDAAIEAQILSGGQRRGLKGGPETLDKARTTYLGTEYSGAKDRRPPKGRITKTDV